MQRKTVAVFLVIVREILYASRQHNNTATKPALYKLTVNLLTHQKLSIKCFFFNCSCSYFCKRMEQHIKGDAPQQKSRPARLCDRQRAGCDRQAHASISQGGPRRPGCKHPQANGCGRRASRERGE